MLEIRGVEKRYGDNIVLNGIDLTVHDGDVIALLGPSGSGKTTFLRSLAYLTRADGGTVTMDGETFSLNKIKKKDLLRYRRKTGFVFQSFNLFANKTALQNVMLGLTAARKIPRDEAEKIALEALEKVGMLDRKDYYPSKLSGGQQQRVAIARAIAPGPEVIFFDEPTSALDPRLTVEVLNVIKSLADEGVTMIVVTHEIEFAQNVANHVVFMENGVIVEQNDAESFFTYPRRQETIDFLRGTRWKTAGENLSEEAII